MEHLALMKPLNVTIHFVLLRREGGIDVASVVSKAFQVLSGALTSSSRYFVNTNQNPLDPQKRTVYDRNGDDPESRFSGMSSRSSGFSTSPFGGSGGTFEGEISPEELFNMFFGGGGNAFGTGFGGGPSESSTLCLWN